MKVEKLAGNKVVGEERVLLGGTPARVVMATVALLQKKKDQNRRYLLSCADPLRKRHVMVVDVRAVGDSMAKDARARENN